MYALEPCTRKALNNWYTTATPVSASVLIQDHTLQYIKCMVVFVTINGRQWLTIDKHIYRGQSNKRAALADIY